jgi:hypothetical protein
LGRGGLAIKNRFLRLQTDIEIGVGRISSGIANSPRNFASIGVKFRLPVKKSALVA